MFFSHPAYFQGVRLPVGKEDWILAARIKDIWDPYAKLRHQDRWFDLVQPVENQHWGSCVAYATAAVIEIEYRKFKKHLGRRDQIDAEAIYRRARELFWPQEPWNGGGLYLDQGVKAAISLGILPPEAQAIEIIGGFEELDELLQYHPMIQGHIVTEAWFHPQAEDGEIILARKDFTSPGKFGLHATALVGTQVQNGRAFLVGQNSWGKDWGAKGYFILEKMDWARLLLGVGPYFIKIPKDRDWVIPDRYIVKTRNV